MNFKEKVVLIPGGTGGLGLAVSDAFLGSQASVVVTYTKEENFNKFKSRLRNAKQNLLGVKTNILDALSVKSLIDTTKNRFGRIEILVNLVGGFLTGKAIFELTEEQWDTMMAINFRSAFLSTKYVLPEMIQNQYGRIINIGAKPGLKGMAGMSAYAAAKAALINFTQSLAEEGKHNNITANIIIPGIIDTATNRKDMPHANFEDWIKPESLAKIILFLSSDEAKDISGAIVPVYGKE